MNRIIIAASLLVTVVALGCGGGVQQAEKKKSPDKQDQPKAEPAKADSAPQDDDKQKETPDKKPDEPEAKPPEDDQKDEQAAEDKANSTDGQSDKPDEQEQPEESSDNAEPSAQAVAAEEPQEPEFGAERVVLLTSRGPLLVELQLSIDGKPHTEAMERLVDYVLKVGDEDGDEIVTWDELTQSSRFRYGQLGNAPFNNEGERRSAIRMYDSDKDGKVDRSEVPRFITRNAGGSRPFSFRGSNYYRDINRRDSPIRLLLDADDDNRLTADEIQNAAMRLRSRDVDNDDLLYASEIVRPDQEQIGIFARRRTQVPDSAVYVGRRKWAELLFSLADQYALGGDLEASAFEIAPSLFAALDADGDGAVDRDEIEALETAEPQLILRARFGEDDEEKRFELVHVAKELGARDEIVTEGASRVTLSLPGLELICFHRDNQAGVNFNQRAMAELMRYDADKNGYIDEDEAPDQLFGIAEGFAAADLDEDGKLYLEEIQEYLGNNRLAYFSQVLSRAGDNNDVMFGALDKNNDGRLDSREISSVAGQLLALDKNSDGVITMNELPDAMALGVVRGNPQQMDALFAIPVDQPVASPDAPRWFQRMDANNDGAISQTEFLGESEQFTKMDGNKNGFVEFSEIEIEPPLAGPFEAPPTP